LRVTKLGLLAGGMKSKATWCKGYTYQKPMKTHKNLKHMTLANPSPKVMNWGKCEYSDCVYHLLIDNKRIDYYTSPTKIDNRSRQYNQPIPRVNPHPFYQPNRTGGSRANIPTYTRTFRSSEEKPRKLDKKQGMLECNICRVALVSYTKELKKQK